MKKNDSLSPRKLAWIRLKKNRLSLFGLYVIVFFVIVSILGYLIMPDRSPNANNVQPELSLKEPGFEVMMIKSRLNTPEPDQSWIDIMLNGQKQMFELEPIHHYEFSDADVIISLYTGSTEKNYRNAVSKRYNLADVIFSVEKPTLKVNERNRSVTFYDLDIKKTKNYTFKELREIFQKEHVIQKKFYLGTDKSGRDLLSRLIIGTRISLAVGFISVFISLFLGVLLGSLAGFFRGWVDESILWLINVMWSLPTLLLVVALTFALGKGFWQVFIAVGLTMWVDCARMVRGQILSIREKEFVEAGKALGFSNFRIISRHILPSLAGQVIVISASNFATSIITEASLSFLGFGAQPPMVSWGKMIRDHINYIDNPDTVYLTIVPGVAIMLLVLAFLLLGNGLRDALDTKTEIITA
ncbi:MAG: ABC transporter permease [Bacteroidota bacterium]|jgi:peptide/nickel transport system permease protein